MNESGRNILNQISNQEQEKRSLELKLEEYENMNYKINSALECLRSAKRSIELATRGLNSYYNSDGVARDEGRMNHLVNSINSKINYLENVVLAQSRINIVNIHEAIGRVNMSISNLNQNYNNLEK